MEYSVFQKAVWWYLLVAVAALWGGRTKARKFYQRLRKPLIAPPPWVYGVVWTALYALQAQASYWVQRETGEFGWECWLYLASLGVSTSWSWFFFGLKKISLSLLVILLSLALSVAVTIVYWDVYALSGVFLLLTTVWIGFASWLNYRISAMNPRGSLKQRRSDEDEDLLVTTCSDEDGDLQVINTNELINAQQRFDPDDMRFDDPVSPCDDRMFVLDDRK